VEASAVSLSVIRRLKDFTDEDIHTPPAGGIVGHLRTSQAAIELLGHCLPLGDNHFQFQSL
jgi:hypothetical protein